MKRLIAVALLFAAWTFADTTSMYPQYGNLHWKAPVAATGNLPAAGNSTGDSRVVKASSTIYIWGGTGWNQISGSSNGSTGATGASGTNGVNDTTGATGQTGKTGATGATGQTGSNGSAGAAGASGLSGATGASGSTGASGATVSFAAFGSSPSANASTISSGVITNQPADATHPGGVSLFTQTLGSGDKTITGALYTNDSGNVGLFKGFQFGANSGVNLNFQLNGTYGNYVYDNGQASWSNGYWVFQNSNGSGGNPILRIWGATTQTGDYFRAETENGAALKAKIDSTGAYFAIGGAPMEAEFHRNCTITSAAAATAVHCLAAADVPAGKSAYLNTWRGYVNGSTVWATTATCDIQDTNGSPVSFISIAVAAMTANAFLNDSSANVTKNAAYRIDSGGTAAKGIDIKCNANGTGSDFVVTIDGVIK